MLRLDKQQHEHEIEQIKARQEINQFKEQTKQSPQMIASLQVLGLEALEKEKSESSSISMHGMGNSEHNPEASSLTVNAQPD